MTGWNMPPGVNPSDIPGNRPEDIEWEKILDDFYAAQEEKVQALLDTNPIPWHIIESAIKFGINLGKEVKDGTG